MTPSRPPERLPAGVWPVMLTPFTANGAIDWRGLDALVEWYLAEGVAGLFAVCLSSEMYELTPEERSRLAEHVLARVAGRVPVVVGGMIGGSTDTKAEWARTVTDAGAAAAAVIVNQLAAQDASPEAWQTEMARLLDLAPGVDFGLYECPVPYHRLLTVAEVRWCAGTGRFLFMKETSATLAVLQDKLAAAAGTRLSIYNAHSPTLLPTLRKGAAGCSNIAANLYPGLFAWLCRHWEEDPGRARQLQQALSLADPAVRLGYPLRAKRFLAQRGLPIGPHCRVETAALREDDTVAIEEGLMALALGTGWPTLKECIHGTATAGCR